MELGVGKDFGLMIMEYDRGRTALITYSFAHFPVLELATSLGFYTSSVNFRMRRLRYWNGNERV